MADITAAKTTATCTDRQITSAAADSRVGLGYWAWSAIIARTTGASSLGTAIAA